MRRQKFNFCRRVFKEFAIYIFILYGAYCYRFRNCGTSVAVVYIYRVKIGKQMFVVIWQWSQMMMVISDVNVCS